MSNTDGDPAIKTPATSKVASILKDLHERAKELNCLYQIEELASDPERSLEEVLAGTLNAIPPGWQYPDVCRVRIVCDGRVYQSSDFRQSAWVQRAPICVQGESVGAVEVYYIEELPLVDEGPFLKEERRLIGIIAERLASCVTHHKLVEAMAAWKATERNITKHTMRDWSVILDLLRRTDQALLLRVARKMVNHLCWSGVKEADTLLRNFGASGATETQSLLMEANRPCAIDDGPTPDTLVDEAFRLAAMHLSDEEIVACIQKWIKQDRASYLVNALENYNTSLAEVADALHRYQHATHGEVELSTSTRKGLRVSLIRRFLTDQLEYINVAKQHVDIHDFHELCQRMIYPARGHGKIGGKSAGLFLASQIVRRQRDAGELFRNLRTPKTWYLTSDGLHDFVYCNHLEDVFTQKYKNIDEVRQEYPDIVQVFKHSYFSNDIIKGLSLALDDFGDVPLIVRSSSLLEDRFGAAFSGKYKSLFLANHGTKRQRLTALTDAIAEIYASTFSPDPILYRSERNLLDFQEGMGIMIQQVVGTRFGKYYAPAFAGVAFSLNEFRWSPRIKREDGLVRLVPGLGTRAVDRLGDDYPIMISPGQPGLRVNTTVEETVRYAPRWVDVMNLETNEFETVAVAELLREVGDEFPALEQLVSVFEHGRVRQPLIGQVDPERDDLVVTFDGLLSRTPFMKQMQALLKVLADKIAAPVDVEFASDGRDLYLLQCRAQTPAQDVAPAPIPHDIASEKVIFSANRFISNGRAHNITHIVYVDPDAYSQLESHEQLTRVGRAIGKLNEILPKRQFILMGPGRWGSRGDVKLGVRVTYSDINNTAVLIEIARKKGDYTPDLSFGTHFFQDLVEASIRYLPLYPDEDGVAFNEDFLTKSPNVLRDVAPEYADLDACVRVIDVPRAADGQTLQVLMNADVKEAVGMLAATTARAEVSSEGVRIGRSSREQDWRWRLRMAEHVAARLDPDRFGVVGFYVFGSVKNATAGPASDIDVLIHFCGTDEQRALLDKWLEGWSLCLAEMNYLRTGYQTDGLLDVHIVTDEDIEEQNSYAVKINAVTDAARPLPLGTAALDATEDAG
jgi:pyruvate,water dikinase